MPTSLRIDPAIDKRYSDLARSTGRPKSFYLKEAVNSAIDRLEYEHGIIRTAEEVRSGRMETYSLEEIGEMFGLDD